MLSRSCLMPERCALVKHTRFFQRADIHSWGRHHALWLRVSALQFLLS